MSAPPNISLHPMVLSPLRAAKPTADLHRRSSRQLRMWWLEHAKDIAETIALICGGAYFGYKAYTGYLRVNLSLSLQCSRQSASGTQDFLIICARISKGPNGNLTLHDVQARVSRGNMSEVLRFRGIERSSYGEQAEPFVRRAIVWDRVSATSPALKLVPGETTELAVHCTVPKDSICLIEVVVLGQQTNRNPFGQWKASCVSPPRPT